MDKIGKNAQIAECLDVKIYIITKFSKIFEKVFTKAYLCIIMHIIIKVVI
jgi:hypothetical protein